MTSFRSISCFLLMLLTAMSAMAGEPAPCGRTYGGDGSDWGKLIAPATDGGFLLVGFTVHDSDQIYSGYRLDAAGNVQWASPLAKGPAEEPEMAVAAEEGGFLVSGPSMGTVKLDDSGQMAWKEKAVLDQGGKEDAVDGLRGRAGFEPHEAAQLADGNYVVVGEMTDGSAHDFKAIGVDREGKVLWERTYGGSAKDESYAVAATPDGGFVMVGTSHSFATLGDDAFKGKGPALDPGAIEFAQLSAHPDMLVVKCDASGYMLWQRHPGGVDSEDGRDVLVLDDGGIMVAGSTASYGAGGMDIWLIKLRPDGMCDSSF